MAQTEKQALLGGGTSPTDTVGTIITRHYCLFISCMMAALQGGIWNTWGPIAPAVQLDGNTTGYGWPDSEIALLANWGPICYLMAFIPAAYALDFKGLRLTMVSTMVALTIGSAIRHIPGTSGTEFTALVHAGQFINGLCGPVAMSVGPVVSVTYYPTHQRTLATSVIAVSNYVGVAATFIVGPMLVPKDSDDIDRDTRKYMLYQTLLTAVTCVASIVYFPSKPSNAPSRSAVSDRTTFWKGFRDLLKNRDFWLVSGAYGIMTGTYSGWGAFLAPNLEHFRSLSSIDESEHVAGLLGFYATLAGAVGGLVLGWSTDLVGGRMKVILVGLCVGSFLAYGWFAMLCLNLLPGKSGTGMIYFSAILGGFLLNGSIPLFYEIAVESMYPIAEGTTTCLLTVFNNIGCLLFLFAPMIPGIGNVWANWTLVAACLAGFLLLIPFREVKARTKFDLATSPNPVN